MRLTPMGNGLCGRVSDVDDKTLAFFGFHLVEQNEEFKVHRDKFLEDHVVLISKPMLYVLYVEDFNDAKCIAAGNIIGLGHDD